MLERRQAGRAVTSRISLVEAFYWRHKRYSTYLISLSGSVSVCLFVLVPTRSSCSLDVFCCRSMIWFLFHHNELVHINKLIII